MIHSLLILWYLFLSDSSLFPGNHHWLKHQRNPLPTLPTSLQAYPSSPSCNHSWSRVGHTINCININSVWNVIPSFLLWCIWREKNAQNFNNCEKWSSDLQLYFLKHLFAWISAHTLLNISKFVDLCALFSFSWLVRRLSLIYFLCTWAAPLALLINYFTYQKTKKRYMTLSHHRYDDLFFFLYLYTAKRGHGTIRAGAKIFI